MAGKRISVRVGYLPSFARIQGDNLGISDSALAILTGGGGASTVPGPTNTGHLAAPGWPGSFTGGTFTNGYPNHFIAASNTTYFYCDFRNEAWVGTPSWSTNITATNVKFVGCRFAQSGSGTGFADNSAALMLLYGDGVTFDYCTFQPSPTFYPTPFTTQDEVPGSPATFVEYAKGYQYAMRGSGGSFTHVGALTIDHCNFWGFGNGLDLTASTVAKPHIVRNSWFHHGADPFVLNTTSTQYHNDCWLVDNGNYMGAQSINNVMEIWGNTNCLAWQGSGQFNDAQIIGNVFGGDQQTISLSATGTSQRITFTDNIFSTRIGRSVGSGAPLRGWAVSDSGTGSMWRRNKFEIPGGAAAGNYPGGYWGAPAADNMFWWPGDSDSMITSGAAAHATDYTG